MTFVGAVRFMANGWIERVFVAPSYFFKYPGLEWVAVWSPTGLYVHYSILAILALFVAAGFLYRFSIVAFALGFLYAQAMDVTNYLNHYYLVVLLCGLMALMPLNGRWSIDAWLWPERVQRDTLPAWMLGVLRFQVATVYFYAALAKLGIDWLLYAQPLNLWLTARTETPLLGPLFGQLWVAYAMSWFGFLYDLTIPLWLSIRRTRPLAYVAVVVFHVLTRVLFDIGMFPIIMIVTATVFFDPDWPERLWPRVAKGFAHPAPRTPRSFRAPILLGLALYATVQLLIPLRHYFYEGDVLWNERGMRYAWKVMVREKNGSIDYRVRQKSTGRVWRVSPREYLDLRQMMEMSGQPDLIVQLGKHIAGDFQRRGLGPVQVFVDTWVSLNGRAPRRMIDPDVDILNVGHGVRDWILPGPSKPPPQLRGSS